MVHRPGAYELIAGVIDDVQFGPVILFGQGGTAVEVIADRALGLPPLNMQLAAEIITRTRIYKQLKGFRGVQPANLEAIALTLIRIAQMVIEHPEIAELDVNPLLADASGVIALDARVKIAEPRGAGAERLAIRPYPKALEEEVVLEGGRGSSSGRSGRRMSPRSRRSSRTLPPSRCACVSSPPSRPSRTPWRPGSPRSITTGRWGWS